MQKPGFRSKGHKAFQSCAKSVLTAFHTFVSDKNYAMQRQ